MDRTEADWTRHKSRALLDHLQLRRTTAAAGEGETASSSRSNLVASVSNSRHVISSSISITASCRRAVRDEDTCRQTGGVCSLCRASKLDDFGINQHDQLNFDISRLHNYLGTYKAAKVPSLPTAE